MGSATKLVPLGCLVGLALTSGCLDRELKALNPCLVTSVSREVIVNNIDKVDLIFSVDNSGSMAEEQNALKQQFPRMINVLTTGMRTPDDPNPFPAAKDLHLGVVSSDMGAVGQPGVEGCDADGGDDGRLQNTPRGTIGCQASYPAPFLSYLAGRETPEQIATDFGCIAELGTDGCGYEQQLEAPFKALWPSVYRNERGEVAENLYRFVGATAEQQRGRGDLPTPDGSQGFLRNDVDRGLSLIAIVVVSDEEDCSSAITDHFRVPTGPNDPLAAQGNQIRCFRNKQNLYDVKRYIDGFKALRPGYENLVVFAGIVGVPEQLVDADARAQVDFADDASRNAYYDSILADDAMQERVVGERNPQTASMSPSCIRRDRAGRDAVAYPPRRMVQVAKGFGANGVIQSICQDDFGPAMDAIIDVIARQLGAVCLPRPLVRRSDGLVSCNVIWELPPVATASVDTPTECGDKPYLKPVDTGRVAINDRGGANCKVDQLPIRRSGEVPDGSGWFYDNFSDELQRTCIGNQKQRVSFSNSAKPNTGVIVKLECLDETQRVPQTATDLRPSVSYQPDIGGPCLDVKVGNRIVSGDDACVVTRTSGADRAMFCHPELNVCVKSCRSSTDCPPAWECDQRTDSTSATDGRAYCVNPTCGAE
ncbi:MAG: hypothetical protein ABW321_35845 [Polyangiales bacterium]